MDEVHLPDVVRLSRSFWEDDSGSEDTVAEKLQFVFYFSVLLAGSPRWNRRDREF